jgi:hypothetical protein
MVGFNQLARTNFQFFINECIFKAYLLTDFTLILIGFWYFTAYMRTFCDSLNKIFEWKDIIIGSVTF